MEVQSKLPINTHKNGPPPPPPPNYFPPSIWGFSFASFSFPHEEFEAYTKQVEVLKERVRGMLMASTSDPIKNIELINLLCHLGLSYHYEYEIEEQLGRIFSTLPKLLQNDDYDLYTTAHLFFVLREHGYKVPQDVFNKFMDNDGKFKKTLINDAKGMLTLYEAAHLSLPGEDTVEEALAFAKENLECLAMQAKPHLAKYIRNALQYPFRKTIPRIKHRQYISFYEEEESPNETLLKFAKIDFNRVQLLHKQELCTLSRWWKDLNLLEEFPWARNRIAEVYFWGCGLRFEPHYALARSTFTKYIKLISLMDDTYDTFGTIEDLQRFTDAMDRCSIDAIDLLPANYMRVLYKELLNLCMETENDTSKEGRSHCRYYMRKALAELARGYFQEAKWSSDSHVPPFKKYVENGCISSAADALLAAFFVGQEEAGVKEYEWLESKPKINKAAKMIYRLMNDIKGHKEELDRGDCATSVECYMKEYGVPEKVAVEELQKMIINAWKDLNEEFMRPTAVPMVLLRTCLNLVRVPEVIYEIDDAYTIPLSLKDHIVSLFVEQVPM